jgi:hypothetical protein
LKEKSKKKPDIIAREFHIDSDSEVARVKTIKDYEDMTRCLEAENENLVVKTKALSEEVKSLVGEL